MGREILSREAPAADERVPYGDDPNQFVDFRLSRQKAARLLVINIHGGFWRSKFDLLHAGNLCDALACDGYHTANVEYRRVGQEGGGWPGTLEDVLAAAQFALARVGLPAVVMGHSAGGHLALWLSGALPPLAGVVAVGPVAHLRVAWERNLGDGAVRDFLGGDPEQFPGRYAAADPAGRGSSVPRVLIHGDADDIVPIEVSRAYVESRAGDTNPPRLVELAGVDHFDVIDPLSAAWSVIKCELSQLGASGIQ
jgi:acetyl esterase/lipase